MSAQKSRSNNENPIQRKMPAFTTSATEPVVKGSWANEVNIKAICPRAMQLAAITFRWMLPVYGFGLGWVLASSTASPWWLPGLHFVLIQAATAIPAALIAATAIEVISAMRSSLNK